MRKRPWEYYPNGQITEYGLRLREDQARKEKQVRDMKDLANLPYMGKGHD